MATESAGTLGILAGGGTLPRQVAEAAAAQGRPVFLVAFAGQHDPATVTGFPHVVLPIAKAGQIIKALKAAGVVDLVMAGGVRRPSVSELGLDWRGVQLFAKIGAKALGDDGLLTTIRKELEGEGFRLVGPKDILVDGTVPAGLLGRYRPDEQADADIAHGIAIARALGGLDVGQSVVVQQGLVLGVEAIEGTDALIARVGPLRREGPGGVLVKIAKPQQDRQIDLPTIGLRTVEAAAASGLRGIAIQAGATLVLEREALVAAADAAGLFIIAADVA
jgi:UDP-2,3-diacylglucosamine hydrolase